MYAYRDFRSNISHVSVYVFTLNYVIAENVERKAFIYF